MQADGKLRVEMIATKKGEQCPPCGMLGVKHQALRPRGQREVPVRGHGVAVVRQKRRFWGSRCRQAFTESDHACGRRRRTTRRVREAIGKLASTRPIAHVASHDHVGLRFVQGGREGVASMQLAARGWSLEEGATLPTPRAGK